MDVIDSRKLNQSFQNKIVEKQGSEQILRCYAYTMCSAQWLKLNVKSNWNPRTIIQKANQNPLLLQIKKI
jgi:hypothetical protein